MDSGLQQASPPRMVVGGWGMGGGRDDASKSQWK